MIKKGEAMQRIRRLQSIQQYIAVKNEENSTLIYKQTAQVINQMFLNIRLLLSKSRGHLQMLQTTLENGVVQDKKKATQHFKQYLYSANIPCSESLLDQKMTGLFVMRLVRELALWKEMKIDLRKVVEQVEKCFEEQKKLNQYDLNLIYKLSINKIVQQNFMVIQQMSQQIELKEAENSSIKSPYIPDIFKVPIFANVINRQNPRSITADLSLRDKLFQFLYQDLQASCFQRINISINAKPKQSDIKLLIKQQLRRNKKSKQDIKKYATKYSLFSRRKNRRQLSLGTRQKKVRFDEKVHSVQIQRQRPYSLQKSFKKQAVLPHLLSKSSLKSNTSIESKTLSARSKISNKNIQSKKNLITSKKSNKSIQSKTIQVASKQNRPRQLSSTIQKQPYSRSSKIKAFQIKTFGAKNNLKLKL